MKSYLSATSALSSATPLPSRAAREASERFRNRRVGKLACQRVWFGSASTGHLGVALLPIRVYPRHLTRSLPLILPFGLPCGSFPSGRPAARVWFKTHNPVQSSFQMSFQKPRHLGKPGVPRVFSGRQFLAISSSRARREKHGRSRSE
jgi:hypothetical protein